MIFLCFFYGLARPGLGNPRKILGFPRRIMHFARICKDFQGKSYAFLAKLMNFQ